MGKKRRDGKNYLKIKIIKNYLKLIYLKIIYLKLLKII